VWSEGEEALGPATTTASASIFPAIVHSSGFFDQIKQCLTLVDLMASYWVRDEAQHAIEQADVICWRGFSRAQRGCSRQRAARRRGLPIILCQARQVSSHRPRCPHILKSRYSTLKLSTMVMLGGGVILPEAGCLVVEAMAVDPRSMQRVAMLRRLKASSRSSFPQGNTPWLSRSDPRASRCAGRGFAGCIKWDQPWLAICNGYVVGVKPLSQYNHAKGNALVCARDRAAVFKQTGEVLPG